MVFCTWSRNSALLLVLRICSISSSSACCGSKRVQHPAQLPD